MQLRGTGWGKLGKIHDDVGKPGWEHMKGNLLHRDRCETSEYARTAQNNIHWHGNMHPNQQHRVQTMQLYYNAVKKYKKADTCRNWQRLKYDIRELRPLPGKLTKAFSRSTRSGKEQETTHGWKEWGNYQREHSGNYWSKHIHAVKWKQSPRNQNGH